MTEWRRIPEFPDYEISDSGAVYSIERDDRRGNHRQRRVVNWQVEPNRHRVSVQLRRNGKRYRRGIGPLVLSAFVGPRPEGTECCHYDGNILNNHVSNLRWDTHYGNMQDQIRHGTLDTARRTHCKNNHPLINLGKGRGCRICRTNQDRISRQRRRERARESLNK